MCSTLARIRRDSIIAMTYIIQQNMSVLICLNHPSVNTNLSIASPLTITNVSSPGGQDSGFVRGPPEHASRGGGQQLSPQKRGGGVLTSQCTASHLFALSNGLHRSETDMI